MTRAEFAKPLAEEMEVDFLTILTALTILASTLPQFMALCQDDETVSAGVRVKRMCEENPVVSRWEIMKTLPRVKPRKHRKRVAEAIRKKIVSLPPEDVVALLEESVVSGQAV